jgi:dihydroorotate dehydrogenase
MRKSRRAVDALASLGAVTVGGVSLKIPFMTASGTAGHDVELNHFMPMNQLGATVVKSLFHEPWPGNPSPRVHLARAGMLNAVGLQGPGASVCNASRHSHCQYLGSHCAGIHRGGRTAA